MSPCPGYLLTGPPGCAYDLLMDITEGATVTVEQTRGMATGNPVTRTVTGVVYLDDEGVLRVDSVPLWRDEEGYLPDGVVLIRIH